jgi:hypothetical protein
VTDGQEPVPPRPGRQARRAAPTDSEPPAAMPTIRVNQPFLVDALVAELQSRVDAVVERTSPTTIRVTILGSYNAEAMRLETLLRVRAWEAAQRARGIDISVELE